MTKLEVKASNGNTYSYSRERLIVLVEENMANQLRGYAKVFFPKPNGDGNLNATVRHIINAVFGLAENPDIQRLVREDAVLNDDIIMFIRKACDAYIKQKDSEESDESWTLYGK